MSFVRALAICGLVISAFGAAWFCFVGLAVSSSDYFGEPSEALILFTWASLVGLIGAVLAVYGLVKGLKGIARVGASGQGAAAMFVFALYVASGEAVWDLSLGLALVLALDVYVFVAARTRGYASR